MADSLKQKTIKGVSWSFIEQLLARGVNFFIGIVLARLLSPTDYGLIGLLSFFIAISQIFIDGGLSNALIREQNASEADYSTVFFINLGVSFLFYILLFFLSPFVASFYNQPLLTPLLRINSLILIISSIASVPGVLLTIRIDFKTKSIISFLSALISGLVGIFCAVRGLGVWALVVQSLTQTTVFSIATFAFVNWLPALTFSKNSFKKLFSFSSKLLASSLINTVYNNAYNLVIGKKFSVRDVGIFSRAGQFPHIANDIFVGAFDRVAFPVLSRVQSDDRELIHVYEKYIQSFCFFTFPLLMGICGCARPLILVVLTEKWIDCVPFMQIICFSLICSGLIAINLNLLQVKGRSDLLLRMEIIKKIIMFIVMFVSMFFGLKAVCYSLILNTWIDLYFSSYYTKKILCYSLAQQLKVVFPYFLASLFVFAESFGISRFIQNPFISLSISLFVCPITYWFMAKIFDLYAYREIVSIIKVKFNMDK